MADASVLAAGLANYFETGCTEMLQEYSAICMPRVWRVQRFSAWMTTALHQMPGMDDHQRRMQLAELEYVTQSPAAATSLAESYVCFPLPAAYLTPGGNWRSVLLCDITT